MTCIKMGSDESSFNVSLIVRDKVTRQCPISWCFMPSQPMLLYQGDPRTKSQKALTGDKQAVSLTSLACKVFCESCPVYRRSGNSFSKLDTKSTGRFKTDSINFEFLL